MLRHLKNWQTVFKKKNRWAIISILSSLLILSPHSIEAIESFEHWGLGIAPIFSFPISQTLHTQSELGLGAQFYFRKNVREWGIELGSEWLSYQSIPLHSQSFYFLGLYRWNYLDPVDFSIGAGVGLKYFSDLQDLKENTNEKNHELSKYLKFAFITEWDLKPNQTLSLRLEYNGSYLTRAESLQELQFGFGYTYYFGFYNFGSEK